MIMTIFLYAEIELSDERNSHKHGQLLGHSKSALTWILFTKSPVSVSSHVKNYGYWSTS